MKRTRTQRNVMNVGSHPSYKNRQSYDHVIVNAYSNTRENEYKSIIRRMRTIFRLGNNLEMMFFEFNEYKKEYEFDFRAFRSNAIATDLFYKQYRTTLLQMKKDCQCDEEIRIFIKHVVLFLCTQVKDKELLEFAMNQ